MIKFSQGQIQSFEQARLQESACLINAEIARHEAGLKGQAMHPGSQDQADQIARFCSDYMILRVENMRRITRAHLKLGVTTPEPHMTVPLRRKGFSEDERVRAYLYALEDKKKRLVLHSPV